SANAPAPAPTASRSASERPLERHFQRIRGCTAVDGEAACFRLRTLDGVGRRVQIALVAALALLICSAVGVYAWDQAKAGEIANGIRVGGIAIGGRSGRKAEQGLRNDLGNPVKE